MRCSKILSKCSYLLLIPLLIATARFCHHQTQGFRITKIENNLMPAPSAQLSHEEIQFMRSLFAQKFHYLGRGLQSFVFVSEDQEYVIKIFNNAHKRKIFWYSSLAALPLIGPWAQNKADAIQNKWQKAFNSYQIAFSEMKDQSALCFMHLNETNTLPPLTLVDRLNISHRMNPNQLGFIIQKKVKMAYPALRAMIQAADSEGAKRAISSLLDLFFWKFEHNICDNDPLIRTNFGFIDYQAYQIDVGPLSKGAQMPDEDALRKEILHITASLKNWLSENDPELVIYLEQQLQERLSF